MYGFGYRSGIYLLVHNQSTLPITLAGGINVKSRAETLVGVSRMLTKKYKRPYSNCISDLRPFSSYSSILFGYFKNLNVSYYDQDICKSLCYQDKLIKKCNCSGLRIASLNDTRYCQTDKEFKCQNSFDAQFSKMNNKEICDDVCRKECTKLTFALSNSLAHFPTDDYVYFSYNSIMEKLRPDNQNNKSVNSELIKNSLLRVIVNYDQLDLYKTSEIPKMDFFTLVCNTGGELSFFIGMSLVSLLEVIEISTELVLLFLRRIRGNRTNKIVPT
jgi:hypothetical protein